MLSLVLLVLVLGYVMCVRGGATLGSYSILYTGIFVQLQVFHSHRVCKAQRCVCAGSVCASLVFPINVSVCPVFWFGRLITVLWVFHKIALTRSFQCQVSWVKKAIWASFCFFAHQFGRVHWYRLTQRIQLIGCHPCTFDVHMYPHGSTLASSVSWEISCLNLKKKCVCRQYFVGLSIHQDRKLDISWNHL